MTIYGGNRHSSIGNIQVEAAENYFGTIGAQLALVESYQEDLKIFDSIIESDFLSISMEINNESAEEVMSLQENAITDLLGRIKEFLMKLWERLKGVFKGFIAKLDSHIMKDSKAYHDKYSKLVYGKNLSKMKAKYSKPRGAAFSFDVPHGGASANKVCLLLTPLINVDVEKLIEAFDQDEYVCGILNGCLPKINISSASEYAKDVHEACFEDEDQVEGFNSIIHDAGAVLVGKPSKVETIRKANTSLEKAIASMIKDIEKSRDAVTKALPMKDTDTSREDISHKYKFGINRNADGKYDSDSKDKYNTITRSGSSGDSIKKIQKALNYIHQQAVAIQSASVKFTSASMAETKFELAQARRIFAAAVAHNPKAVSESAVLEAAFGESAEWEVMSAFDELN